MCHVMKKLLATIGVHPTVIELDDHEIAALPSSSSSSSDDNNEEQQHQQQPCNTPPAVFIGGTSVSGLRISRGSPPQRPPRPQTGPSRCPLVSSKLGPTLPDDDTIIPIIGPSGASGPSDLWTSCG
ncbi:hypothetical protein GBA52_008794 [Prunus armeniaca]|nr:hypothetical protein GBA52_008794 [Prunus armeniaca]